MDDKNFRLTLSVQEWEKAKGSLRAIIAILGSCPSSGYPRGHESYSDPKFLKMEKVVDDFIAVVEENEYHI